MPKQWCQVWQDRPVSLDVPPSLAGLLAMDGFDGFGGIRESSWLNYIERLAVELPIGPDDSLFDVGCGAGAFLYPWYLRGHRVGGIDISDNLLEVARQVMPRADLCAAEAIHLDASKPYDTVLAHSVFFYFPDLDYAASVLMRMIDKAKRSTAILDVPDSAHREECLAQRRRTVDAAEYDRKYSGLEHLYYDRKWFADVLRGIKVNVRVEDQSIPGYAHNPYRFNVFIARTNGAE